MSDNKKYYYLKLRDNFFDNDDIAILESMPDGILYSNILLKLYLRSLKNNGKLMFNDRIPYNAQMLSTITRQPIAVVEKAVGIFKEMGLLKIRVIFGYFILHLPTPSTVFASSSTASLNTLYEQSYSVLVTSHKVLNTQLCQLLSSRLSVSSFQS